MWLEISFVNGVLNLFSELEEIPETANWWCCVWVRPCGNQAVAGLWALLGGRGRGREREAGPVAKEVLLSSPRRRFTGSVIFRRGGVLFLSVLL